MLAYCVKCKATVEVMNSAPVAMKNGRLALTGTCCVCGAKIFKIGKVSS